MGSIKYPVGEAKALSQDTVVKHSPLSIALAPDPLTVPIPSTTSTPDPLDSKMASGVM